MDIGVIRAIIGLSGAALIVGLVQVVKPFISDTRFYPVISIIFGLLINLGAAIVLQSGSVGAADLYVAIILGLMAGLSASGLYSGYQSVKGK